ncbi:hypothetical protein HF329_00400 [Chitinophaga oryzae]|uniref:Uncharacterized protein n=1 Tax=Chitinophaga oryzae TaxID=2725414 RepID=A0AAE7D6A7_9BACT|nr:hypothetical protein [Chitinophaga oryzae]QJB29851.1 hypothetical protein HF329_00400 [Chitinophaga oryzae]
MDTTKKTRDIESGSLELVLEEFTEEQKLHTKTVDDLVKAVNGLSGKLIELEEKMEKPKGIDILTDTRPIQEIVRKGIVDIKLMVAAQPKNVIRKFQLLLFPEQDAKLFYRVVFGRWFIWLVVMLLLNLFYKLSIHWMDNKMEIKLQQLNNDKIDKNGNYIYKYGRTREK